MKLGVFAKIFARPTLAEVFAAVAQYGLRRVQFNFASAGLPSLPERINPDVIGKIEAAAKNHGVEIAAVSGTFNMIHPDVKQREQGLRALNVIGDACQRFG